MRKYLVVLLLSQIITTSLLLMMRNADAAPAPAPEKEWTFLIYMSGNNNLDRFGTMDMNEMEKVGSTDKINVVVQWASLSHGSTRRVLVKKDQNTNLVTSPALENIGDVDMGDWRTLVKFIEWGVANYPAKHYFIDVWDHGSGWHLKANNGSIIAPRDISHDDNTGNAITTEELGKAMREAARIIGKKVDLYGSDACLMAMAEVADEMSDSVEVFAGSEDLEPAKGWDYGALLEKWNALENATGSDVAKILTQTYVASYQGGSQGNQEVTFSALDLRKIDAFNEALRRFGAKLQELTPTAKKKVLAAARNTLNFTYDDYGDLSDFLDRVEKANIAELQTRDLAEIKGALADFVIANLTTPRWAKAKGVALWLPSVLSTYDEYQARYRGLRFHGNTQWGDAVQSMIAAE